VYIYTYTYFFQAISF